MFYLEEGYSTRGRLGNFLLGLLVLKREWALNFFQRFRVGKLYDEICFLFRRKNSFCSWDIYIFVVTFDHVGKQLDKAWFPLWVNVRYLRQYLNIFSLSQVIQVETSLKNYFTILSYIKIKLNHAITWSWNPYCLIPSSSYFKV